MFNVFFKLCREFGWRFEPALGMAEQLPDADVVVLRHGLIPATLGLEQAAAVHLVRDPRDISVSGYEFHLVTTEAWCTNEDFDRTRPISFPRVPYSQQHRDESWKSDYLDSLGGRSYQQNLRDLPRAEGLHFEIARYGGWTAEQMANFRQQRPEVPMLKFEALMSDFDGRFEWLFSALGLAPALMARAMTIARSEDLGRRSPPRLRANPHTTGGASSRWEEALDSSHQAAIEERFGESITRLEYRCPPPSLPLHRPPLDCQ